MKYEYAYREAAILRTKLIGGDVDSIMEHAKAMDIAGVDPARIYAFCQTGIWSSSFKSEAWANAVWAFNEEIRELG